MISKYILYTLSVAQGNSDCLPSSRPSRLRSLQVVLGATEEPLPHSLGGVFGHRGPPGSVSSGVQQGQRHVRLQGRHGGRRQLHAGAALHAEQRHEKENQDFGKVIF